jgi:hypothetical protein
MTMSASCDGSRSPDNQNFAARSLTPARNASSAAVLRGHKARATIAKSVRVFGEHLFPSVPCSELDESVVLPFDSPMTQYPQRNTNWKQHEPHRPESADRDGNNPDDRDPGDAAEMTEWKSLLDASLPQLRKLKR